MEWSCALLRVLLDGVLLLLPYGIVCAWACKRGERRGVATVATLGSLGGAALGGGTTLGGGFTLGGGVVVAGERGGNSRGVLYLPGGACVTCPDGVVGGDVVGGAAICGMRCLRIESRRLRRSRLVVLRWYGMQLLILLAKVLAVAMTWSEGVIVEFVRYLYLLITVAEMHVACVSFIHMVQARKWSNEVPRMKTLLQRSAKVRQRFGLSWTRVSVTMGTKGVAS